MTLKNGKKINRRSALRLGAVVGASAATVVATGVGTQGVVAAAPNQAAFPFTGLRSGLVATDLEVVTVTDTSVTFSWAT